MKRVLLGAMILGILTASRGTAQRARVSAGYGRMLPTEGFSDNHKPGWQIMGAVEVAVPRTPLGLRADAMHGRNGFRSDFDVGTLKVSIVTAGLACHMGSPAAPVRPYLFGGVGYSVDEPGYDAAFAGGAGVAVGAGRWKAFLESRFMTAGSIGTDRTRVTFVAITGGVSFGT